MPVIISRKHLEFPDYHEADADGLLAIGGDLSIARLKLAYSKGIFPWYDDGYPILWWSPDPRMVLFPHKLKVSQSLKQTIRNGPFTVSIDQAFADVIVRCASTPRQGEHGTWITTDMQKAYIALHKAGLAHSAEAWYNGELVGGLYGVALGKAFFGESMFHQKVNASKVAFCHLVGKLRAWDFQIIDAQVHTSHLESLGAEMIARSRYLEILNEAQQIVELPGSWHERD